MGLHMIESKKTKLMNESGGLEPVGRKLRARRRELGLTLQDVADGVKLSVGFISQLERDLTLPSLSSLAAISQVLQININDLLVMPASTSATTRSNERRPYHLKSRDFNYERISASFPGRKVSAVILHKAPGHRSDPIQHGGEELFFVLNGSITVEIEGKRTVLNEGDSLHFPSHLRHSTWNHTLEPTSLLIMYTLDVFGESLDGTGFHETNSGRPEANRKHPQ